jgi:hypothetical protein
MFNPMKRVYMPFSSLHAAPSNVSRPGDQAPLTASEQRLLMIGLLLGAVAILGTLFAEQITLYLQLNAHGHARVHSHGHPFIDARTLWGIPNALDVLSNLAFLPLGGWGLWLLYRSPTAAQPATRLAATVFFVGLVFTCFSSSFYHWAPSALGLAIDRAGMAVAFAGVLGLAAAERISLRCAPWVWGSVLAAGLLAAMLNYTKGAIAPWAVVQFGGMAVVLWTAAQPADKTALGVRWGVLIAIYVVAKLLELGDETVFNATGGIVSGHSLKHVAASLAALPVIAVLRHNALHSAAA